MQQSRLLKRCLEKKVRKRKRGSAKGKALAARAVCDVPKSFGTDSFSFEAVVSTAVATAQDHDSEKDKAEVLDSSSEAFSLALLCE